MKLRKLWLNGMQPLIIDNQFNFFILQISKKHERKTRLKIY